MSQLDETLKGSTALSANPAPLPEALADAGLTASLDDAEPVGSNSGTNSDRPADTIEPATIGTGEPATIGTAFDARVADAGRTALPQHDVSGVGRNLRPLLAIAAVGAVGFVLGRLPV